MKSKIYIGIVLALGLSSGVLMAQDTYQIQNLEVVNSEHLDFSPVPYKNGIMFTSTRDNNCKCKDKANEDNFTDLFYADFMTNNVKPLKGDLNGKRHDGVASWTSNGNVLYATRTNTRGKRKDGVRDSKIYKYTQENGEWIYDSQFPFNSNDFATCHPSVTVDGKRIYFASNRPGSIGGMDIWVTTKGTDGKWAEPKNLGDKINTPKNEVFPYIAQNGDLYFSSNGQPNAKGLDLYKATGTDFMTVTALGEPFNSPEDDFGFSMAGDGNSGYFSSNRIGGKGGDDIYMWFKNPAPLPEPRLLSVVDASDASMITKPVVTISAPGIAPISSTDDVTSFVPDPALTYTITVKKDGYEPKTIQVSGAELAATPEYKVPMLKPKAMPQPAKLIIKSRPTQETLPNTRVEIEKICDGKRSQFTADASGTVALSIECDCQFRVTAIKDGYNQVTRTFSGVECANPRPLMAVVELEPVVKEKKTFEGTELKKGAVITLKDIYYDYDKYYIRPDAAKVLDKVVSLMQQYPSLELELASHTDCRGNNTYNQTLSQNRAESAVKYIVSRGIDSKRLIASGYGETQLKNECADGVKCSEEKHQENRRTELRVTRFDEPNVEVRKE